MLTQRQVDEIYDDVAAEQAVRDRLEKDIEVVRDKEKRGEMSGWDADQAQQELEKEFDLSDEHRKVGEHSKRSKTDHEVGEVLQDARVKKGMNPNSPQDIRND